MATSNLLSSQWGRAFEALRDSPIATDAMGVGTYRHKAAAFAFGSGLGGLAGGLYAFNFQYLQPQIFVWELMVILLLGVVLGGRKSLWGAVVGAALIVLLPNLLSNRVLFQVFSAVGLAAAAAAGARGLSRRTMKPFKALAPIGAMAMLAAAAALVPDIEDLRRAIFRPDAVRRGGWTAGRAHGICRPFSFRALSHSPCTRSPRPRAWRRSWDAMQRGDGVRCWS